VSVDFLTYDGRRSRVVFGLFSVLFDVSPGMGVRILGDTNVVEESRQITTLPASEEVEGIMPDTELVW
jgi:hypothetical protein